MLKKRLKWIISFIILLALIAYVTMTPIGALRFKIITLWHPISAFTFIIKDKPYEIFVKNNQQAYSLDNPPFYAITQSEMVNWIVTKHGIFYTADYYGWG